MTEQADRLKELITETGVTMRELSDRWGWSYDTLKSNANGSMPFSYKKALVYATRFGVRAEWLYSGAGPKREAPKAERRSVQDVPVIGWVQAGQFTDISAQDLGELETVTADGLGAGKWFATDVHGDSMDRVSPEGSRIFVNSSDKKLVRGGYYIFSMRGETTYKRYYDDPVERLEPYSTNPVNRAIFPTRAHPWVVVGRVYRSVIDLD